MYLSRIEVNQRRRETVRALSNPRVVHAAIEASFPVCNHANKRTLWRVEMLAERTYFLVLSGGKPDFTHIVQQFGWPEAEQRWQTKDYTSFIDRLTEGQQWHFRLCANPTHSVVTGDRSRGKVYGHVTVEQQKEWLLKRAANNGFNLCDCAFEITSRNIKKFRKAKDSGQGSFEVTINTAVFEGDLTITDKTRLTAALLNGIGKAKAYGCGLLTLAKSI